MVVEEPDEVCDVLVGEAVVVPVCGAVVVADPLLVEELEVGCGAVLVLLVDVVVAWVCGAGVVVDPLPGEEPEAICGVVLVLLVDDAGAVVGAGVAAEVLFVVDAGDELVVVVGAVLCDAACDAVGC
ncbi:hypothetical protein ASG52_24670 [Methylobacterium sp. Leaf456]|nr:hypothetical protein ASG52_24670 [Methylobacterium sp. Leaf456]